MAHDGLGAHARDELGISKTLSARPLQAALASACSFAVGSVLPLVVVAFASEANLIPLVSGASLLFLAVLGGVAAHVGGAQGRDGYHACDILGCVSHGSDGRHWGTGRTRGVATVGFCEDPSLRCNQTRVTTASSDR